ncbi:MAG TPA: hypothetical protein VK963_00420, partial [Candidatus Saccharimonadales bacterium]|nr:hypothetical protein [Candidatus Saccharimonadales bacterium]
MNLPKLPKKIQSRRFILPVMLLLVGALAGGGWLYKHRQNRLSLQSKQEAVVAAMEEGKLARQATVKTV